MALSVEDQIDPAEEFIPRKFDPKPYRPEEIDPAQVVVSFDRLSDTLLIHLFGRGLSTVSVAVGDYLYLLVDPDTEKIVGFHVEGFLTQAVKEVPTAIDLLDYAEVRGMTLAEVRALQQERGGDRRRDEAGNGAQLASRLAEQRWRTVSAFVDAERSRLNSPAVPELAESHGAERERRFG
jgi:hypothetical protein